MLRESGSLETASTASKTNHFIMCNLVANNKPDLAAKSGFRLSPGESPLTEEKGKTHAFLHIRRRVTAHKIDKSERFGLSMD